MSYSSVECYPSPGFLGRVQSYRTPTLKEAKEAVDHDYVDYFRGKPIKTYFNNYPRLNKNGYDNSAGKGMMQKVVSGNADYIGPYDLKLFNGAEMVSWLKSNRPCTCGPSGVKMYLYLLKCDLRAGKSGWDNTKMPLFDMNDWTSVEKYVIDKAKSYDDMQT